MNLERTKPETLAAAALDLTPSHFTAAHEYAERLNAALARLGLTDRLTLPSAPATAIDELPGVVDVPLRKTLSVLMGKAQQGDASALATLEWTAQVEESIFAGLHARASVYPLALPSHESLATLSQGVDALLPRKISNGAWSLLADGTPSDGIQDGMSLVRLLCSDAGSSVTELKDDNEGWVMTKALSGFPNLEKLELGCKENTAAIALNLGIKSLKLDQLEVANNIIAYGIIGEDIMTFPKLRFSSGEANGNNNAVISMSECRILYFPELQEYTKIGNNAWLKNMPMLEELYMPKLSHLCTQQYGLWGNHIADCEKLWKVVYGKATQTGMNTSYASLISGSCPNLIHLEFGEGTACSIGLLGWSPTTALSERLPEFLSNFKTYIAERLSEQGGGKTLTLSQAVRDAIEGDPTIAQIITSKGWTISPAPSV